MNNRKIKIYEEFISSDLEYKFKQLKNDWVNEIKYHSNPDIIYNNENYKNIINLGNKIVPLLINDLNENNGDWLYALSKILNVDPVKNESRGDWDKMKKDWNKYIIDNEIK